MISVSRTVLTLWVWQWAVVLSVRSTGHRLSDTTPLTENFLKVMVFWPYASELHDGKCRIQPLWSMTHGGGGLQVRICRPSLLSLGLSDRWAVRLDVVICSADPCQLCSISAPIKFTNGGGLCTHTLTHIEMCVSPLQISTFYISEDYGNPLPFTSHPLLLCVCVCVSEEGTTVWSEKKEKLMKHVSF